MPTDDLIELELILNRFRQLMRELQAGRIGRNEFKTWEVELLLDIEHCQLDRNQKKRTLRHYQKAAENRIESGCSTPLKLSEFLALRMNDGSESAYLQ